MFDFLSGAFWLFGITAVLCLIWHFARMQIKRTQGSDRAQQNEVAIGGGVFVAMCAVLWLAFAGLSAAI